MSRHYKTIEEIESELLSKREIKPSPVDPIKYPDCWWWTGGIDKGYGNICWRGYLYRVHRISAKLWKGFNLASKLCVPHHCDNKMCFNPEHLFIGTHQDNNEDKVKKNRQAKGAKHGRSKLDHEDVIQIRRYWENKEFSVKDLSEIFKVSMPNIRSIINRKIWN